MQSETAGHENWSFNFLLLVKLYTHFYRSSTYMGALFFKQEIADLLGETLPG